MNYITSANTPNLIYNIPVFLSSDLFSSFFIDYENTDPRKRFKIETLSGSNPKRAKVLLRNPLDRAIEDIHNLRILAIDKGN